MRTRAALVIAVVAFGGLLAACGEDSDALTKEEFIAQGDALCQRLEDEADEVEAPASEEEFGSYLEAITDAAAEVREDFAALEPPADGEDVHDALLGALDEAIEAARGAAEAASSGDTVSAEDLAAAAAEAGEAADEAAQGYGFEVCGAQR